MKDIELYNLKYPIGEYKIPENLTEVQLEHWIHDIEKLPSFIIKLTENLSEKELNYPYRPNGWTIRQVVHHLADSHMNSIIRFKLAMTEEVPTIRPYYEDHWANLADYKESIDTAISIITGVHQKLGILLKSFSKEDLRRQFIHPEHDKHFSIEETIGMYAWHSNHHLEHIKQALELKGSF